MRVAAAARFRHRATQAYTPLSSRHRAALALRFLLHRGERLPRRTSVELPSMPPTGSCALLLGFVLHACGCCMHFPSSVSVPLVHVPANGNAWLQCTARERADLGARHARRGQGALEGWWAAWPLRSLACR